FAYLLFATHAVHLAGGVIALMYAAAASWMLHKPIEAQRIVVDIAAWYWHFMALLWIYIVVLLMIVRQRVKEIPNDGNRATRGPRYSRRIRAVPVRNLYEKTRDVVVPGLRFAHVWSLAVRL